MLDAAKQRDWYRLYLMAALSLRTHDTSAAAKRWAYSMALIAEQFVTYDGADPLNGYATGE